MTTITLSNYSVLVLFDLIARVNATDTASFADDAEQDVLRELEAELERAVNAVLSPEYSELPGLAEVLARMR